MQDKIKRRHLILEMWGITQLRGLHSASMLWKLLCRQPARLSSVAGYTQYTTNNYSCMISGITSDASLTNS